MKTLITYILFLYILFSLSIDAWQTTSKFRGLKTMVYYSHSQFCGLTGLGWVVLTWILSGRCKQMATGVDASWLGLDLQGGNSGPSHWNSPDFFHGCSGHHEAGSPELAQGHFHHVLLVKTDTKSRPVQTQGSGRLDPPIPKGKEWTTAISEVQLTCTLSLPTPPQHHPRMLPASPLPYFILGCLPLLWGECHCPLLWGKIIVSWVLS